MYKALKCQQYYGVVNVLIDTVRAVSYSTTYPSYVYCSSVSDPHNFYADPDPDPRGKTLNKKIYTNKFSTKSFKIT